MEAYHGQVNSACRGALNVVTRSRSRSRSFILSTTNQPKKIEELPSQKPDVERESAGSLILWTSKQIYRDRDRDRLP